MKFPWAKREHCHPDPTTLKYSTCSRCGHLILSRHLWNKTVVSKSQGIEAGAIFGRECAPSYDEVHRLADDSICYYRRTEAGLEVCIPDKSDFLVVPPENMSSGALPVKPKGKRA